jgi:hypothetical protein
MTGCPEREFSAGRPRREGRHLTRDHCTRRAAVPSELHRLLFGFFMSIEWATDRALFWAPLYYEAKVGPFSAGLGGPELLPQACPWTTEQAHNADRASKCLAFMVMRAAP